VETILTILLRINWLNLVLEMRETSVMHNFQGYFSRTFQDLKLQFPGLSKTKVIFQDFPGHGIFKKKNPGLSMTFQEAWEPWKKSADIRLADYAQTGNEVMD